MEDRDFKAKVTDLEFYDKDLLVLQAILIIIVKYNAWFSTILAKIPDLKAHCFRVSKTFI